MTGAVPDRRQDQRALGPCTECGTPHDACTGPDWCCQDCLHLDADWEGYRQPADEQAVSPVPGQQREAVADELARHVDTLSYTRDDDMVRLGCTCGHDRGTVTKRELAADLDGRMREHRLHVADAVIAVLNGPQSPPSDRGRAEGGDRMYSGGPSVRLTSQDEMRAL